MTGPKRIQRKRTAGWRMPEGAVYVGRPSVWGNPYRVDVWGLPESVELYRQHVAVRPALIEAIRRDLAGKDVCCWCRTDQVCHGDVLLEIAATPTTAKEN